MNREERLRSDSLLLLLHNMGITGPKRALRAEEIPIPEKSKIDETIEELEKYERDGYVKGLLGEDGLKRYYLTDRGIIKVCASLS